MSDRAQLQQACRAGAAALNKYRPGTNAATLLLGLAGRFAQAPKPASSHASKSEWATMREEVTRKSVQAVQEASAKREAGTITDRELWLVIDALFDTTHGLVDEDVSALIYQARQELKEHAPA